MLDKIEPVLTARYLTEIHDWDNSYPDIDKEFYDIAYEMMTEHLASDEPIMYTKEGERCFDWGELAMIIKNAYQVGYEMGKEDMR